MPPTTTRDPILGLMSRVEIDLWKLVAIFVAGAILGGVLFR